MEPGREVKAQVITVSDRCSRGEKTDKSGPLAAKLLAEIGFNQVEIEVVPDGIESVVKALREAIGKGAKLIFTTGGTGISPTDYTPEATEKILAVKLDGLANQIRTQGHKTVPAAILSRGLVGLTSRDKSAAVVVNAPGSTGGVKDAVAGISPVIWHILDQIEGKDH